MGFAGSEDRLAWKLDMETYQLKQLTESYISAYRREQGNLQIGETEVPLKGVYIMLEAVEKTPSKPLKPHSDIVEISSRQSHTGIKNENITDDENSEQGSTPDFVSITTKKSIDKKEKLSSQPISLLTVIHEYKHIMILGEPGAGKSSSLQYIGLHFADQNYEILEAGSSENRVPIYLNLKQLAERLKQTDTSLKQVIVSEVKAILQLDLESAGDLFEIWLSEGMVLLLLDGLDEVPELQRQDIRLQLTRFARSQGGRESRIVVASRMAGYIPLGCGFKDFLIKPFEDKTEITPYIQSWLKVLKPEWDQDHVLQSSQKLLLDIESRPALKRIVDNPLLLRLAIESYAMFGEVVSTRAQLYEKWLDVLWQRGLKRGLRQEQKKEIFENLEKLAWCLHNDIEIPEEIDIDELRIKLGLIVRIRDLLTFSHLTIQEYFVSRYLVSLWHRNSKGPWLFLATRLYLPEWIEPILLLSGLLNKSEQKKLIGLISDQRIQFEDILHRKLILLFRLYSELNLIPSAQSVTSLGKIIKQGKESPRLINGILEGLDYLPPKELVLFLLTTRRSVNPIYILYNLLIKLKIETKRSVIVDKILDWEIKKRGSRLSIFYYPLRAKTDIDYIIVKTITKISEPEDALLLLIIALFDSVKDVHLAALQALGQTKDNRSITYLLHVLKGDGDADARAEAAWALGEIGSTEVWPALLEARNDRAWSVRFQIAKALGKSRNTSVVSFLIELINTDEDSDVRLAALKSISVLSKIDITSDITKTLIKALGDNNQDIRQVATDSIKQHSLPIRELIQSIDEQTEQGKETILNLFVEQGDVIVDELISALSTDNVSTSILILQALYYIDTIKAHIGILKMVEDGNQEVRNFAAYKLEQINDPMIAPHLNKLLKNKDAWIRKVAIVSLIKLNAAAKKDILLQGISDENRDVRYTSSWGLVEIGEEVLPDLFHLLKNSSNEVKEVVTNTISAIGTPALPFLEEFLADDDLEENLFALDVLRKIARSKEIKPPQFLPYLREKLNHSDFRVRGLGAKILGEYKDTVSFTSLISLLNDSEEYIRISAITGLGRFGMSNSIPPIVPFLNDENAKIRVAAIFALGDIGSPENFQPVIRLIEDKSAIVRAAVAATINEIDSNKAFPFLLQLLDDKNEGVRSIAVRNLSYGIVPPVEEIPKLLDFLKKYPALEFEITNWLSRVNGPSAIPYISKALEENDPTINNIAARILHNIDPVHGIQLLFELSRRTLGHYESYMIRENLEGIEDVNAVPYLLAEIANYPEEKHRILRILRQINYAGSISVLIQMTRHAEKDVRIVAFKVLSAMKSNETSLLLIDGLKDWDWEVSRVAIDALIESKSENIIPYLVLLFRDDNPVIREKAIETLCGIGTVCVPYLIHALEGEHIESRRAAVRSLGFVGDKKCTSDLLKMLNNDTARVQEAVIWALGAIGDIRAFPGLVEVLGRSSDGDAVVLQALRKIGGSQSIPYLVEGLSHSNTLVRKLAIFELTQLDDDNLLPYFLGYLAEVCEDKDILHELRQELDEYPSQLEIYPYPLNESEVRWAVNEALDRIDDAKAMPCLIDELKNPVISVRESAAEILERIGTPQVIPALIQAIKRYGLFNNSVNLLHACIARLIPPADVEERKKWLAILNKLAKMLVKSSKKSNEDVINLLLVVANKIVAMSLRYSDPSVEPLPSRTIRIGRSVALFTAISLLIAIIGVLAVFSNLLTDLLKAQWFPSLKSWIAIQPGWALLALVVISAVVTGLIAILLDWLKNRKSS